MPINSAKNETRISVKQWCLASLGVIIIILSCHITIFFTPTRTGTELLHAIRSIENLDVQDQALSAQPRVLYEVTRHSRADIAARNIDRDYISSILSSKNAQPPHIRDVALVHREQLALSIFDVSTNTCTIYASAQTFDTDRGSIGLLATLVREPSDRWAYLLLHERAHCTWNATLLMERLLQQEHPGRDVYSHRAYRLSQYLGEAFADVRTAEIFQANRIAKAERINSSVCQWRRLTTAKGFIHRTHHALAAAKQIRANKGDNDANFLFNNRITLKASLIGMYYWLKEQGLSDLEIDSDIRLLEKITQISSPEVLSHVKDNPTITDCETAIFPKVSTN